MQPPVDQYTPMKSGDQFLYEKNTPQCCIYTLQKLPDFPLWVLISEFNQSWMAPMDTSFGAFGNCHSKFVKIEK
jgi:hypothetical protein